jgi:hypothetical protein
MNLIKRIPGVLGVVAALVLVGGCDTLNIKNPNDPDKTRALSDPATIKTVAVGALRAWYLTSHGGFGEDQYPELTLIVMARSHTAMWNNFNIRFYTGCTDANWDVYTTATNGTCGPQTEGPFYPRAAWQNNLASAQRTQIEAMWYGYYAALASANDVLTAIRQNNVVIENATTTKMVETMALLAQALSLSELSLNYDKAFIVDYYTPLSGLTFSNRVEVRDAALAKFDTVIANANANTFAVPGDFFGGPAVSYDNVKIAQIANTMAARTLAYFPRDSAENKDVSAGGAVDWTRVASYASNGISSGTPFDLLFHQDGCVSWCDFMKVWTNDMTTMRIHTRVAHLMDPATQPDPYDTVALKQPNSPDKRLGNGYYRGDSAYAASILRTKTDPVNGGTDYVWTATGTFGNKTRGLWHQSAVGQIRYDSLTACGDNPQGKNVGVGDAPAVLAAENDLIWAEALIRRPSPDPATAATLINKTRVGRGGLTPATAGDPNLLDELLYEQDVELPGSNIAPYYNQRRLDKLEPGTPHEMPVPAKELAVDQQPLYTWGGASDPPNSPLPTATPSPLVQTLVVSAPKVYAEMQAQARARMFLNGVLGRRRME